jgi:hypothetical protein
VVFVAGVKSISKQWGQLLGIHTEPVPIANELVRAKDRWAISSTIDVPRLKIDQSHKFVDIILNRRTKRECEPIDLHEVLSLIQFALSSRQIGTGVQNGRIRKVPISAGALHPVEVLVVSGPMVSEPILYCDSDDTFGTVPFHSPELAKIELQALLEIVPQAVGHCLLLVANQRHVKQAYEQSSSLLWRDAGALLQTISLLATAMNCAFIPLGSTGSAVLNMMNTPHNDYVAVGTGIIGKEAAYIDAVSQ